jgi:hypothetical protein
MREILACRLKTVSLCGFALCNSVPSVIELLRIPPQRALSYTEQIHRGNQFIVQRFCYYSLLAPSGLLA